MTAAVAELAPQPRFLEEVVLQEQPLVRLVPEMIEDEFTRHRAAKFIGNCLLAKETEVESPRAETVHSIDSLYDALQKAHAGDVIAGKSVETNVATDMFERIMKAGFIKEVEQTKDEFGRIQQYGQSAESIQANNLIYGSDRPQMRQRFGPEVNNAFRLQQLYDQGLLKEHSFVVWSCAADNMNKPDMDDEGFFTDTMSLALQVTTVKNGKIVTESAFIAGVETPGGVRYDKEAIAFVAEQFGVDLPANLSAAELIDHPWLMHNSLLPKHALTLVERFDDYNDTFFGEAKPRQDYEEYRGICKEKERMLAPKVQAVKRELIALAPTIKGPVEATELLHELSEKHMVQQAVFDRSINPRVFGVKAAPYIERARIEFEQGNLEKGLAQTAKAIQVAESRSCPGGSKKNKRDDEAAKSSSKDNEDCEFISKQCPVCGAKNVKTRVTKTRITGDCGCSKSK